MKKILNLYFFTDDEKDLIKSALEHYDANIQSDSHYCKTSLQHLLPSDPNTLIHQKMYNDTIKKCEQKSEILKKIRL